MKSIVDILSIVVGSAALIFALYQFYMFVVTPITDANHTSHLWMAIGSGIVACVCLLAFFLRRVNDKEEEIHITQ